MMLCGIGATSAKATPHSSVAEIVASASDLESILMAPPPEVPLSQSLFSGYVSQYCRSVITLDSLLSPVRSLFREDGMMSAQRV
jgi:hypothetical protein